jgi:salicylate hydroxylase
MKQFKVLVIGAGMAGLAQAIALAKKGHRVTVLERSATLSEQGAGIQLGPNGLKLLDQWGLLDAVNHYACQPDQVQIRSWASDKTIATMNHSAIKQRYGYAPITIHRADLQAVLFAATKANPSIRIVFDQPFEAAQLASLHTTYDTSVLIGADGLWSQTRHLLGDASVPRFSGKLAFRSLLSISEVPQSMQKDIGLWLGPRAHLVHYPVRAGTHLNVVAMWQSALPTAQDQQWGQEQTTPIISQVFANACAPLQTLLRRCQAGSIWSLYDRPPQAIWHKGQACLVGDAAHPMQAHLAQGASMAFEDAAVMAQVLGTQSSVEQDFVLFTQLRSNRTAAAQNKAAQFGAIYQASGLIAWGRNLYLSSPLARRQSNGLHWLYQGI